MCGPWSSELIQRMFGFLLSAAKTVAANIKLAANGSKQAGTREDGFID